MSEILNTGIKLWSIKDDYDELQTKIFEELTGSTGKSNMRIISELIEDINSKINGYCFKYLNNRLYIYKNDETEIRYPVSIIDDNGHVASKVDGSTINIDETGIIHGIPVDVTFSPSSTNPIQNKVVTDKFDEIEKNVTKNTEDISKNVTNISNNAKKITSLETAVSLEKTRAETVENQLKTDLENGKKVWNDKYTKAEIDNKFSVLETNIDWKESVETYDDIVKTYPIPQDGWTVNIKDTNITYRYDGIEWIAISANAIPQATSKLDGLMTKEYAEKLDSLTKYTPDGTTITADKDGTLHGTTKIDIDTILSSSSENPVQNKVVNNAIKRKADIITYDKSTNTLYLKSGSDILSSVEIKGGGGSSFAPKEVTNVSITNGNGKVTITWTDPNDVILEGVTLSTWAGTKLVMNESDYPTNENDGTVILNSTTRNEYQNTGYEVTGLTNNKTYYFALFPYSTDGIYNYSEAGRLLGKPSLVKLDPCTNIKATATMGKVTVTWTDPAATKTVGGNTATWQKTVLVYKQGTTTPTDVNDGTIAVEETTRNQYQNTGYEVTSLIDGNDYSFSLFAISTDSAVSDATSVSAKLYATLTVTTKEASLYGKAVTVTSGSQKVTDTFSNGGSVTLRIPWIGDTSISATDGTDTTTATVNIVKYGKSYNAELSFFKIVTFANGTDEEIVAMIEAHYAGKINISDYWAVGDKRKVNLSAMSATGVGESHRAQTVEMAIADFDHDNLAAAINGHTKAAITLTQVDCLMDASNASNPVNGSSNSENGYMNSSNTNNGGWTNCARRTWCNNVYFNALPSTLRNAVKTVNKKTSAGSQSSTINTTTDKVFLLAEVEIFGTKTYSFTGEGEQYAYYKTTANRYKKPKWSSSSNSNIYWERSPYSGSSSVFCYVDGDGGANWSGAGNAIGCAPCLCI